MIRLKAGVAAAIRCFYAIYLLYVYEIKYRGYTMFCACALQIVLECLGIWASVAEAIPVLTWFHFRNINCCPIWTFWCFETGSHKWDTCCWLWSLFHISSIVFEAENVPAGLHLMESMNGVSWIMNCTWFPAVSQIAVEESQFSHQSVICSHLLTCCFLQTWNP